MPSLAKTFAVVAAFGAQGSILSPSEAAPLTCRYGAFNQYSKGCGTIETLTPQYSGPCDDTNSTCFTANYAGDWYAAYGCYPKSDLDIVKAVYVALCSLDPQCAFYNSNGVPEAGYTICDTDLCNPCNSATPLAKMSFGVLATAATIAYHVVH
jgi:hypothetical protein